MRVVLPCVTGLTFTIGLAHSIHLIYAGAEKKISFSPLPRMVLRAHPDSSAFTTILCETHKKPDQFQGILQIDMAKIHDICEPFSPLTHKKPF